MSCAVAPDPLLPWLACTGAACVLTGAGGLLWALYRAINRKGPQ